MKIEYDKVSGALYLRMRDGKPDHAEDLSEKADVYAHVDSEGNVLGLEALSLEDLTQAIEEHESKLEVPEQLRGAKVVYDSESILKALDSLSQSDREVLQPHYFQGLSRAQVADHLGVSMAATRQLQHTALRRLQVALKREEPGTVDDADLEAFLFTL